MRTKGPINQAYVYNVVQILNSLNQSPALSNISASRFHAWYTKHCSLNTSHIVFTLDLYPSPCELHKFNSRFPTYKKQSKHEYFEAKTLHFTL